MEVIDASNFIIHFKDVVDPDVCRQLIQHYQATQKDSDQDCFEIPAKGDWKEYSRLMEKGLKETIELYIDQTPALKTVPIDHLPLEILHFPKGEGLGDYRFDSGELKVVELLLFLNDVDQGGETEFFHQQAQVIPRAGHAIVYPCCWTHLHSQNAPGDQDLFVLRCQYFLRITEGSKPTDSEEVA